MTSRTAKAEVNRQGWETAEFPILCETCLGDNPYVRMGKEKYGKECKICDRPFTIFRWLAGAGGRYKKTEVCQTCSKIKNVCQTCVFDLQYGLPVEVRDKALGIQDHVPRGDVNREYFAQNAELKMEDGQSYMDYTKLSPAGHEMLKKLSRAAPYYKRNRSHICSFFVKGHCSRGDECPYRHEMPEENELTDQNIKDRYYGTNDPVAKKILGTMFAPSELPVPPEDRTITSVFISGITNEITEADIRDKFYAFGEIRSVQVVHRSHCAFVNFTTREATEQAINKLYNSLEVRGTKLKVNWGRVQQVGQAPSSSSSSQHALPPPPPPSSSGDASTKAPTFNYPVPPPPPGKGFTVAGLPAGMIFPPPPPPPGAPGYFFSPTTPDLGARTNKRKAS